MRFTVTRIEYLGPRTKSKIEQFAPLVQQALTQFVKDLIDLRLKSALEGQNELPEETATEEAATERQVDAEYPLHLFLDAKGIQARARYDDWRHFVVLAGSQAVKDETSTIPEMYGTLRKTLLDDCILVDEGATYRLASDQTFNSSSGAATFLLASGRSGLRVWRDADGRLLGGIAIPPRLRHLIHRGE